MFTLPRQQQYIIILLLGALLLGGAVSLHRQYRPVETLEVEGLRPVEEEEPLPGKWLFTLRGGGKERSLDFPKVPGIDSGGGRGR